MKIKQLLNKEENLHSFNEALQQIRKETKIIKKKPKKNIKRSRKPKKKNNRN